MRWITRWLKPRRNHISCILSSYNRPRMVRDALNSVARQIYRRYELIVVDDSDAFDIRDVVPTRRIPWRA